MPAAVFGATGIGSEELLSAAGQREKSPFPLRLPVTPRV